MSEQESMSERELAEHLADTVFGKQPRSVGEALAAADAEDVQPGAEDVQPPAEPPVVVDDVPTEEAEELEEAPDVPTGVEEPEEEEDAEDAEDENVVWAKSKYGDDPAKWAKAAFDQEQHISRLANEKKEAEKLAGEWYEYAQQVQADADQSSQIGMPLSASEEQWIESSLANPYQAARQAAMNGNVVLFNGVINRLAEENPGMAAQISAGIQREMDQFARQDNGFQAESQPTLQESLAESIQRLGINLGTYGEPMSAKIGELGEFHPYVQTILEGDPNARDIALMAVYDLVRSTAMSTRKVRSEEREATIKHEAELRRQAAGVVTGGPQVPAPPEKNPMISAMEEEWRARGQWSDE